MTQATQNTPRPIAPRAAVLDWSELIAAMPIVMLVKAVRDMLPRTRGVGGAVPAIARR